jgi:hypothetical protein
MQVDIAEISRKYHAAVAQQGGEATSRRKGRSRRKHASTLRASGCDTRKDSERGPRLFRGVRPVNRAGAMRDTLAGLTLATMNVPQALGYTLIAGTPVVPGLYTLLLPLVAFGDAREGLSGVPTARPQGDWSSSWRRRVDPENHDCDADEDASDDSDSDTCEEDDHTSQRRAYSILGKAGPACAPIPPSFASRGPEGGTSAVLSVGLLYSLAGFNQAVDKG